MTTVRVVHDPVEMFACLRPVNGDTENLCLLRRGHKSGCLPLPWPEAEINAENPRFRSPQRCACGRPVPTSSACGCCCAECDS